MSELDAVMAPLRQRFVARAGEDLAKLRAHLAGDALSPESLRALVHRLAGSAGLFGFPAISALAGELDLRLAENGDAATLPGLVRALEELLVKSR